MSIIGKIVKNLRKDKIIEVYNQKNRYIDTKIYTELKSKKKCDKCKEKFNGQIPEIHHIIPHGKGGTNNRNNLLALCKKCHKIMDSEEKINE